MDKSASKKRRAFEAVPEPSNALAKQTLTYLDVFGYFSEELDKWKDITVGDIVDAVKVFQGMFGIKKSGELTMPTVKAMQMPRCGCPDIAQPRFAQYQAVKAFAKANLPAWRKRGVAYKINGYVPGISKTDFETTIYNAFQAWTKHGELNIRPATGAQVPDIVIGVGQGKQDDFDGPSGVLAWCYLPDGNDQQLQCKFDSAETWVLTPQQRGILLANVATHEFGHGLGLSHSRVGGALMAPTYNQAVAIPQDNDDIPRFVARYGARSTPVPPPVPPPTGTPGTTPTGSKSLTVTGNFSSVVLDGVKII